MIQTPDAALPWPSHHVPITIPDAGLGLVTNNGSDQISLLDLTDETTIGNVRVGIDPIANDGPHHLAVDPASRHVFVALNYPPPGVPSGPHAGHGTSVVNGWVQMLDLDDLHELARHEVDANPGDIALTPDATRVLVTHFNLAQAMDVLAEGGQFSDAYSRLWILNAQNLQAITSVPVCVMAHGIAISADGTRAYIACNGQDALAIVHLDDPAYTVEPLISVGPGATMIPSTRYGPYAVLLTHDQQYVVVSDLEGQDVRIFDVAAHAFDDSLAIALGGSAYFGVESPDQQFIFIPLQAPAGIARIRRSDWSIDQASGLAASDCLYPHEIAHGPDGLYYMVCEAVGSDSTRTAPSRVDVIDPGTLAVTGHYSVGVYPDRVVFVTRSEE